MELTATAPPLNLNPSGKTYRIESIDLLRGLIMIIMALDHTRDFFHAQAFSDDPLNLQTTYPGLFFTRWITHFCAPVFVFLAGTSGYLQSLRKSKKELSGFLIKRGLWLILVDLIIMSFAFSFNIEFSFFFLQTIWSIGIGMLLLGLAIWLPFAVILILGILITFGHNLLDFYEAGHKGPFSFIYHLIHRPTIYPIPGWDGHFLFIFYPFLSWTGIMFLGYCFGRLFISISDPEKRKKTLTWLGIGIILFFIALRFTNVYGDPGEWKEQKSSLLTIFSFINTQKYPPSLLYACMTLGPALIFLAWAGTKSRLAKIITVFGRVPFFYYVLHFFILHTACMIFFLVRGHSFSEGLEDGQGFHPYFIKPGEGYSLLVTYIAWFALLIILYPLCKWFSNYKKTHKQWWLSYL